MRKAPLRGPQIRCRKYSDRQQKAQCGRIDEDAQNRTVSGPQIWDGGKDANRALGTIRLGCGDASDPIRRHPLHIVVPLLPQPRPNGRLALLHRVLARHRDSIGPAAGHCAALQQLPLAPPRHVFNPGAIRLVAHNAHGRQRRSARCLLGAATRNCSSLPAASPSRRLAGYLPDHFKPFSTLLTALTVPLPSIVALVQLRCRVSCGLSSGLSGKSLPRRRMAGLRKPPMAWPTVRRRQSAMTSRT